MLLRSGDVSTTGRLTYRAGRERPAVTYAGSADIDRISVVESASGEPVVSWSTLHADNLRFGLAPDRLEIAEVVDPSVHHGKDQVFFGATVTYADETGKETVVTIMGIDEADSTRGQVSWISPIAQALLKAREGDEVRLMTPAGWQTIDILSVAYPAP